ncbi:DUF1294 domain-containing protein [Pseudomonas fontis]|uniref:DUF1294 domain-containing protein n=1 Tax=Pseudomonas fontis TaxID=2942633 RepID=A0ABT5NY43_9PSED|nr:DUF1294 domain-containing protein [Pseudomonas fontis]MDD0972479.1 DUF1294 domain-containing protein [Pseudomonas fontis]MDD0993003.1 DUF1294 domain-containing protein [Pseudomonas fontis]
MRFVRVKLLVLALLGLLPFVGVLQMGLELGFWVPALVYLLASLVCVWLYRQDKRRAAEQGQRTPEKVLHGCELLGGWPGALLAQQLYRHKTRKVSYQLVFWLIVLVHQVFWADYLFLGGRWLGVAA